jgi:hypothetical protein
VGTRPRGSRPGLGSGDRRSAVRGAEFRCVIRQKIDYKGDLHKFQFTNRFTCYGLGGSGWGAFESH